MCDRFTDVDLISLGLKDVGYRIRPPPPSQDNNLQCGRSSATGSGRVQAPLGGALAAPTFAADHSADCEIDCDPSSSPYPINPSGTPDTSTCEGSTYPGNIMVPNPGDWQLNNPGFGTPYECLYKCEPQMMTGPPRAGIRTLHPHLQAWCPGTTNGWGNASLYATMTAPIGYPDPTIGICRHTHAAASGPPQCDRGYMPDPRHPATNMCKFHPAAGGRPAYAEWDLPICIPNVMKGRPRPVWPGEAAAKLIEGTLCNIPVYMGA